MAKFVVRFRHVWGGAGWQRRESGGACGARGCLFGHGSNPAPAPISASAGGPLVRHGILFVPPSRCVYGVVAWCLRRYRVAFTALSRCVCAVVARPLRRHRWGTAAQGLGHDGCRAAAARAAPPAISPCTPCNLRLAGKPWGHLTSRAGPVRAIRLALNQYKNWSIFCNIKDYYLSLPRH